MEAARYHRRDGIHLGKKSVVPVRRLKLGVIASAPAASMRSASARTSSGGNSQSDEIPTSSTCAWMRFSASVLRGITVRQVEGVHGLRDHQVGIGIEALHEFLALVIEVAGHVVAVLAASAADLRRCGWACGA